MVHIIAHDIRSRENVGALLRTCEFLGVDTLWLTGYTPVPPDPKIEKVSLGAEKSLEWKHVTDITKVIAALKKKKFRIVGLEIGPGAKDLSTYRPRPKTAVILGNEVTGVPPSLLKLCDDIVMIKRRGKKESLNVAIAAGIAAWAFLSSRTADPGSRMHLDSGSSPE